MSNINSAGYRENKKRHAKTREQISEEYGISVKTLKKWIKNSGIELPKGLISPSWQERLYQHFGHQK